MFILAPWKLAVAETSGGNLAWANTLLIVINVICFALGLQFPVCQTSSLLALLLYGFSHAGYWHLAANMWLLWLFGAPLNRRLGNGLYLCVYLGTLLVLGVLAKCCVASPVLGASGAVYAVIAMCLVLQPRGMLHLFCLAIFPLSAVIGIFAPPPQPWQWLLRWQSVTLPLLACLAAIPILLLAELSTLGWNWATTAHLFGLACGLTAVLLLPQQITMRTRRLSTV